MLKRTPCNTYKSIHIPVNSRVCKWVRIIKMQIPKAKVCATPRRKTTYPSEIWWRIKSARRYVNQVQVVTTAAGCNLRTPSKRPCDERKIIILWSKSLPRATEIGVVVCYSLNRCVISHFQRW